jgi:NAD(P)-dependent dehydrogenase (short-subunit alcohol dehydrogenase family)
MMTNRAMRLASKIAVVTGAGSGIGRAIALQFAEEGARLVLLGQRRARLDDAVGEIIAADGTAVGIACNIADAFQVEAAMRSAVEHFGRIDVLVNNAAKNRPDTPVRETVAEMTEAWWSETLAVNLTGYFLCCKYALVHMLETGGGSVINIASTSGLAGNTNQGAYVASKHGVVGLTKSIALDYGRHNVRANAICPGFIETERSVKFSTLHRGPDWRRTKLADIPLGRFGRPADVANLAVFLASDESAFITGAAIPIDGGTAARR